MPLLRSRDLRAAVRKAKRQIWPSLAFASGKCRIGDCSQSWLGSPAVRRASMQETDKHGVQAWLVATKRGAAAEEVCYCPSHGIVRRSQCIMGADRLSAVSSQCQASVHPETSHGLGQSMALSAESMHPSYPAASEHGWDARPVHGELSIMWRPRPAGSPVDSCADTFLATLELAFGHGRCASARQPCSSPRSARCGLQRRGLGAVLERRIAMLSCARWRAKGNRAAGRKHWMIIGPHPAFFLDACDRQDRAY